MYFKKSENIARNALDNRYAIDDVQKLDKYLARRNLNLFSLFDVKSNTGLGSHAELILKQYVKEGILREPEARYLCPVHNIALEQMNSETGNCLDCDCSYTLAVCVREMVYKRLQNPRKWSDAHSDTSIPPPTVGKTALLKDRRLHIGVIQALIVAGLGATVALYIHFNPIESTGAMLSEIPDTIAPSATLQTEPTSTPTQSSKPSTAQVTTVPPNLTLSPHG